MEEFPLVWEKDQAARISSKPSRGRNTSALQFTYTVLHFELTCSIMAGRQVTRRKSVLKGILFSRTLHQATLWAYTMTQLQVWTQAHDASKLCRVSPGRGRRGRTTWENKEGQKQTTDWWKFDRVLWSIYNPTTSLSDNCERTLICQRVSGGPVTGHVCLRCQSCANILGRNQ